MSSFVLSWRSAEQLCYRYLLDKLQAVEGVDGYCPEIPLTLADKVNAQMWWFRLGGGDPIWPTNAGATTRSNRNCYAMNARLEGFFLERDTAMDVGELLVDCLPAGPSDITDIIFLELLEMPNTERATRELDSGATGGREVRGWSLVCPMRAKFNESQYTP